MKKVLLLLLSLAICFTLLGCATKEEKAAYQNALACFEQERYADAAKFFVDADGYKDSEEKLLELYYAAVTLYEAGAYFDAKEIFDVIKYLNINDDAVAYGIVLDAYEEFFVNFNAKEFFLTIDPYIELSGMPSLKALVETLCYPYTSVVRFEYVVSNGNNFNVYESHEKCGTNNERDSFFYEYQPESRLDTDALDSAWLQYLIYFKSIGGEYNEVTSGYSFSDDLNDQHFIVFTNRLSSYITVGVYP